LPSNTSAIVTGVTSNASIVPRSHSRAITKAVSSAPIRVIMMAIRPGTRKLRLRKSLLNQMRGCDQLALA